MAAPTILEHWRPDRVDRLLRPLFTGEEIWCQLFSEPGGTTEISKTVLAERVLGLPREPRPQGA